MRVFVDADACPVKKTIIEVTRFKKSEVILVSSFAHFSFHDLHEPHVQSVTVDSTQQAADLYIANHLQKGDLVVTQDYGLAALVIAKQAYALHHTGFEYTDQNLDELMLRRHLSAKVRRAGGKTKGPRAFSIEDQERFKRSLLDILHRDPLKR